MGVERGRKGEGERWGGGREEGRVGKIDGEERERERSFRHISN